MTGEAREWMVLESMDCSTCGQPMPFEAVDCADGHAEDCPDRVCIGCGLVLVVGPVPLPGRAPLVGRRTA